MKKIKKAKNEELEEILTKAQMEIFENEIEPEMRKQMKRQRNSIDDFIIYKESIEIVSVYETELNK